jgi:ribose transport system substrate-binding protein
MNTLPHYRHRRYLRRSGLVLLSLAITSVALSSCSSSNSTSTSPSTPTAGTSSAAVSAAKAAVASYEQVPNTLSLPPLTSKAPAGKTVVFINAGSTQTNQMAEGIQAAATAIGWNYRQIIDNQADSSSVLNAFKQALLYKPYVVSTTGSPYSQWSAALPSYQKAGAFIIPSYAVYPNSATVPTTVAGNAYFAQAGTMLADWLVADSDGSGSALFVGTDIFSGLALERQTFDTNIAQNCPKCSVTTIQLNAAQALGNQGNSLVVTALQRNPNIKYVVEADGAFLGGLSSSLASAGLSSRVKIGSGFGALTNLDAIKAGNETVTTGNAEIIAGWLLVDAALRRLEGMSYPAGYGSLPTQLLTKTDNWQVASSYNYPPNYQELFKKLWLVSS